MKKNALKILLISKHFPPVSSARALQVGKLVATLQSLDLDLKIIAGIPIGRKINESNLQKSIPKNVFFVPYSAPTTTSPRATRRIKTLSRRFSSILLKSRFVSDATNTALQLFSKQDFDVLVSFSSPLESHLAAKEILSVNPSLKWIASFSDPLPGISPFPYSKNHLPVLGYLELRLLRNILTRCNAVLVTNDYAAACFRDNVKLYRDLKYFSIPHIGTDPYNHAAISKEVPDVSKQLLHLGNIQRERVSLELLIALNDAKREMPDRFEGLLCIGSVCEEFRAAVKRYDQENIVQLRETVDADTGQCYACNSRANLVIEADMRMSPFLPSKFADYAQAGRPIIAITPPRSPIRDYINDFGGGIAVGHDRREILSAIRAIFGSEDVIQSKGLSNKILANQFSKSRMSDLYQNMFDDLLNSPG